jgi:general secretion pathway protein B
MSYLLDALRKSELERRVGEVPKLTPEVVVQPARRRPHPFAILVLVLVLINFATLFYISVRDRAGPDTASESPSPILTPEKASGIPELKIEPELGPDVPTKKESPQVDQKPPNALPSRVTGTDVEKPFPAASPTRSKRKQAGTGEPRAKTKSPQITAPPPAPIIADEPANAIEHPDVGSVVQSLEAPSSTPVTPTATATITPASEAVPFLADLPRDFQRDLPALVINVYVYSEVPEERFVIINMKKYSAGQTIDNGPEILEIRADSLVLAYLGRKFRVQRP